MTDMPSTKQARRNIEDAWSNVSEDDLRVGMASYPSYHAALKKWANYYNIGFVQTVEAFAALSPNNDYHGNLRSLSAVMFSIAARVPFESLTISTYRACGLRALGYLTGQTSFLDTVSGPKITAFRHNLLYPDTSRRVTVDGHMVAVWAGRNDFTMKDAAAFLTTGAYRQAERDITSFAGSVGLPPSATQATLWISRKRRNGIKFDTQEDLFSGATRWDEIATPEHYPPFQMNIWRGWNNERKEVLNV